MDATYLDCVKDTGNYFSLQNGLRSINQKWGNSFLASAFLGNEYSDFIELGQDAYSRNWSGAGQNVKNTLEGKAAEKTVGAAGYLPGVAGKGAKILGKFLEIVNPYNIGSTVFSAGILCPIGR
jgi:hypothetical protein